MKGLLLFISLSFVNFSYSAPVDFDLQEEIRKLELVLDVMDKVRTRTVSKHLDHDEVIDSTSYQQYDQNRRKRQQSLSRQELEAELRKLTKMQVDSASRMQGTIKPSENTQTRAENKKPDGTSFIRPEKKEPSQTAGFDSEMHARFHDFIREYEDMVRERWEREGLYGNHELADYIIEVPERLTGKPTERIKVRVNPSKMELLKQKHALDQLLIDDVLRMTGQLPSGANAKSNGK